MYVAKYFFCLYFLLYDQLIFIYVGNLSQLVVIMGLAMREGLTPPMHRLLIWKNKHQGSLVGNHQRS